MTVRGARAGDVPFVVGLVPRFVEHGAADGHTPDEVIAGTARVLRDAIERPQPDDLVLIAEQDGERAGFLYAVTDRDFFTRERYLHVSEIVVARSGAGVGARLMEAAEAWAQERGYRIVTLNVVEENVPAQRFYARLGYAPGHRHLVKHLPTVGHQEATVPSHRVIHFELPADEPERAIAFYRDAFGWEIRKWDGPLDYWTAKTGAGTGIDGAFLPRAMLRATTNTIAVDDLDAAIDRVHRLGGTVTSPPVVIPQVGRFCYAADTEGNAFGMMQHDGGETVGQPTASRNEDR